MKNAVFVTITFIFFALSASGKTLQASPQLTDTLKKGKNYVLFSKTENIETVNFSKSKKSTKNIVYLRFGYPTPVPSSNAVNGTVITSKRYNEDGSVPIFDKIDILSGSYKEITNSKDTKYRNLFTITDIEFPLRLKLFSGQEAIDLELTEPGEWNIQIELKNN